MSDGKKEVDEVSEMIAKDAVRNQIPEVVFRTGEALKLSHPKNNKLSGVIDSPARFINRREGEFEPLKAHCVVNINKGKITLVIDEQSENGNYEIVGKCEKGKIYQDLRINSGSTFGHVELSQKLKMLRYYFTDKTLHMNLVKELKNVSAKVEREVEKNNDDRGNITDKFKQTVQSINIPSTFEIRIPLIEGQPAEPINVEILLATDGRAIICYLESVDASERIDEILNTVIEEQVKIIEEKVLVIYE